MAFLKITLTFNSLPALDTEINIKDDLTGINLIEVFKNTRTQIGETRIGSILGECAYYYGLNFNIDYNSSSLYTLEYIEGATPQIVITATNENSLFIVTSNTTAGAITTAITSIASTPVFSLDSISIAQADADVCNNVKITVTTSEQADSMASPVAQSVFANPFITDITRGKNILVSMVKDGNTVFQRIEVPKLLSTYFSADVVATPSNAAVSITNSFPKTPLFTLQYSLDNITWQTSNYFNNLTEGSYTAYIKDNLGCTTSIGFNVTAFTPNVLDYDGIAEISNLNSIRYKEDVVWDTSILKTPDNTLSFEEDIKLPNNSFTQAFNQSDIIATQIKTNYENVTAKIIDDSGTETPLLVTKMTANMNITDVRDVSIQSASYNNTNYTIVKYSGGKTYDPITLAETGDYNIGVNVPDWINKDDYLSLEGVGWYKVLDIIYSGDAYVVIINQLFADFPFTTPITIKATTVYNALDYENYEFDCDFSARSGFYKVQVNLQDDNFGAKQYLSEWLNIKESHPNTALIEVYNSENNEINYNTGIKHRLRIPLADSIRWKPNSEIELYVTDTNTVNLDTKYRGFWELSARPLPTMMAEKLVLFLLQDRIFINTVNYVSEGEPESVNVGGQYQIKANLVKSNYVYELYSGKGEITIETTGNPLSISPNGGFLLVD